MRKLLTDAQIEELKGDAKGVENNGPSSLKNFGNSGGGVLHWNQTCESDAKSLSRVLRSFTDAKASAADRDLMAHPVVVPILEQLCGSRFRLDHINVHTHVANGYSGSSLHGGSNPGGGNGFYFMQNGQMRNGLVAVTWELEDTHCNGGGFCCIPGSASPACNH
eukprot:SAG31_NODE_182_length_21094_cov_4.426721_1_plen_164_part_00